MDGLINLLNLCYELESDERLIAIQYLKNLIRSRNPLKEVLTKPTGSGNVSEERRSRTRGFGRIKQIEDVTYELIRKREKETA